MESIKTQTENKKELLISELRKLRYDWRSEMIPDIIHSFLNDTQLENYKDTRYKVRKIWFQWIVSWISLAISLAYEKQIDLSEELYNDLFTYHMALTRRWDFHIRDTNKDDIAKAEQIVDKLLSELEK